MTHKVNAHIHEEAHVVINGHVLSRAESMTLRVAVSDFMMSLSRDGLGDDEIGKAITERYIAHSQNIQRYISGRVAWL